MIASCQQQQPRNENNGKGKAQKNWLTNSCVILLLDRQLSNPPRYESMNNFWTPLLDRQLGNPPRYKSMNNFSTPLLDWQLGNPPRYESMNNFLTPLLDRQLGNPPRYEGMKHLGAGNSFPCHAQLTPFLENTNLIDHVVSGMNHAYMVVDTCIYRIQQWVPNLGAVPKGFFPPTARQTWICWSILSGMRCHCTYWNASKL